jgi:hypothetical protein
MLPFDSAELRELPYWSNYSKPRLLLHAIINSKYFDLSIAGVIGLNVITMALEFHMMPRVSPLTAHRRNARIQVADVILASVS